MKKDLSSVRKLLGSADRATVESGVELVKALNLPELNEKLVEGLVVEPISNDSDAFGRRNLCAVSAESKAEVVKRVKAPHRGFVTLNLLKLAFVVAMPVVTLSFYRCLVGVTITC